MLGEDALFRMGGLRSSALSKLVVFLRGRGLEYISSIRALFLDAAAAVIEGEGGNERWEYLASCGMLGDSKHMSSRLKSSVSDKEALPTKSLQN